MKQQPPATAPLFPLGQTVQTPNALATLQPLSVIICLGRHVRGDWGNCGKEDAQSNNDALKHGDRLFSVYQDFNGVKFWIITEADRSVTTVLLPEDY
jgi:hypothetical protein